MPRPLHVNRSSVVQSTLAEFVLGGNVEHTIHSGHRVTHAFFVGEVTFVKSSSQRSECRCFEGLQTSTTTL